MVQVPYALSFDRKGGVKPGRGEAGWTVASFKTMASALAFMRRHPEAEMPAWNRFPGWANRNPNQVAPRTIKHRRTVARKLKHRADGTFKPMGARAKPRPRTCRCDVYPFPHARDGGLCNAYTRKASGIR